MQCAKIKTPVESVTEGSKIASGILAEVERMVTTRQAGLEIAEDSVDPPELGSLLWFASGDNCKMVATANFSNGTKASENTVLPGARQSFAQAEIAFA